MLVAGFPAGAFQTNCYVLAPGPGEACVVVDPGQDTVEPLEALLDEHRLTPVAVLLTHGHFDHTFSVVPVCQARDVPAYVHPADRGQLTDPWSGVGAPPGTPLFGSLTFAEPEDVRTLADGGDLELAGLRFTVRHAPGHTEGSILLQTDHHEAPVAFTGDVLFAGSIGRTDLPGGSMPAMLNSLKNVVLPMADEVMVCPGHGPRTTIGRERATNPFLKELL